ncbi:MAG: UDP-N-acetylglucosamine 2-epimerase, partial [Phycisphaerales bacterium]
MSGGEPIRVCIVTGTRAECGLLEPVMRAVRTREDLQMQVVVSGAHLLPPAFTRREVERHFVVNDAVYMQAPDQTGRTADSAALGRGVSGFAEVFERLAPDWAVVLGDRIEAFAAAAAASVGGVGVAHIHAGDRAEGVADEAMRHAISKLAHLHLAATAESAARLERMGESSETIRIVGSPAIDGLAEVAALDDASFEALGAPEVVLLLHPCGRGDAAERATAERALRALECRRVLALHPNHDPGRQGVLRALEVAGAEGVAHVEAHLARAQFVALLRRLAGSGGALVGNSSAGLIEAAALRCPVVDIGARQGGRERPGHVVHTDDDAPEAVARALREALTLDLSDLGHPYG